MSSCRPDSELRSALIIGASKWPRGVHVDAAQYRGCPTHLLAERLGSDNDANTRMVLDHLADRGARRIALLAPDARLAWVEETSRTFASWTQAHDRPPLVVPVPHEHLEGSAYASASDPPITALDLHPAEHAAAALELLVARLAGDESVRTRSVAGTLCVRASTGPA